LTEIHRPAAFVWPARPLWMAAMPTYALVAIRGHLRDVSQNSVRLANWTSMMASIIPSRAGAEMARPLAPLLLLALLLHGCDPGAEVLGDLESSEAAAGESAPPGTFSIVAHDPDTGELGVAVHSRVFSVGNGVMWGEAGVGVAATQAWVDVSYGPRAIELLAEGLTPEQVVERLLEEDPDPFPDRWPRAGRQISVMDAGGRVATWTGPRASDWAGHRIVENASAQGNILAGPGVVDGMIRAFQETDGHLSFRLLAALEAGQAEGGDTRGKQSAAMLVVKEDGGVWLNNDVVLRLQVDDHPRPITELRRLVELAAEQPRRP
jgi:uncharacterized Ntn-hydrolase superfamily protein